MDELKPCPFCGSFPYLDERQSFNNPRYCDWYIGCIECDLEMFGPDTRYPIDELILKWNSRRRKK